MNCFLFNGLSSKEFDKVKAMLGAPVIVNKGGELYRDGSLCILCKGTATVRRLSGGHTVTVRTALSGEVFGSASVFGSWKQGSSSIVANETCTAYYLCEELLKKIMSDYPIISFNYIQFLTDRIRFLNRRLDTFSADNTEKRVYEYFASVADGDGKVTLSFGMAELARRLNVGRTSLYRSIATLEQGGLIIRNKNTVFIVTR